MAEWRYWMVWRWHKWRIKRLGRAMHAHISILADAYPEVRELDAAGIKITVEEKRDG